MAGAHVTHELRWTKALPPNFSLQPARRRSGVVLPPIASVRFMRTAPEQLFSPPRRRCYPPSPRGKADCRMPSWPVYFCFYNGVGSTFRACFFFFAFYLSIRYCACLLDSVAPPDSPTYLCTDRNRPILPECLLIALLVGGGRVSVDQRERIEREKEEAKNQDERKRTEKK